MNIYLRYRELLGEFIGFKSISTDSLYKNEIELTVEFLNKLFKKEGLETEIINGFGNPILIAKYNKLKNSKTCLIYGHYDVQPADESDGWFADPFTVVEKDGRLYARGIVDNKGQTLIHIATILELMKFNKLKYNVTFLLEGNEETGSDEIPEFLEKNIDKIKSDFYLISDGTIVKDYPTVERSFRGIVNTEIKISTSKTELHSGLYGGIVPNAGEEASRLIVKLKDDNHNLKKEILNENIKNIEDSILKNNQSIPVSKDEMLKITGTKIIFEDKSIDMFTKSGLFTSMEVTGIKTGYINEGFKNAVPNTAIIKINFRLEPKLDFKKFQNIIDSYILSIKPDYVDLTITHHSQSNGVFIETDNEYIKTAEKMLEEVFHKKPLQMYIGAIIPIVKHLKDSINIPALIISLANEDCAMHAVNENFDIEVLKKGIEFSKKFFGND